MAGQSREQPEVRSTRPRRRRRPGRDSDIDPVRRTRFLAIHRLRHEQALDEYRRIQSDLEPTEVALANVLQYAIFHEEAVLRWFEWMAEHGERPAARP